MARKAAKAAKAGAPESQAGADDLEIIHPERSAEIAGRVVVVREYGFIEGLRLRGQLQPLLDDLVLLFDQQHFQLDAIEAVLGRHADLVVDLVAIAADVEPAWVSGLSDQDGTHLLHLWWGANGPFFVRRAISQVQAARVATAVAGKAENSVGATSTPPSSPQGTEPPPNWDA